MFFLGHCVGKRDCVEWLELNTPLRPMTAEGSKAAAIACAFDEIQKRKTYFSKRSVLLVERQKPKTQRQTDGGDEMELSERRDALVPLHIIRIQHATDVAVILVALRNKNCNTPAKTDNNGTTRISHTHVDRAQVERDLERGHVPWVPPSRSRLHQWLLKRSMDLFFWRPTVEFFSAGPHRRASLCYFRVQQHPGVRGHVALTLDDAPGRFGSSRLEEVRLLLKQYNAKATFMMVGSFLRAAVCEQNNKDEEEALVRLLQDGHEFGNHGGTDQPHHRMTSDADFVAAVNDCSQQIRALQQKACTTVGVHYFRAPHGKYTKHMRDLLKEQCHSSNDGGGGGLINVMCDAYASDPIVQDGAYIARSLTRQARHGGIILLHMPETLGFRDHCMVALRGLLEGLTRQRQFRVVSVGMLEAMARQR